MMPPSTKYVHATCDGAAWRAVDCACERRKRRRASLAHHQAVLCCLPSTLLQCYRAMGLPTQLTRRDAVEDAAGWGMAGRWGVCV